MMRRDRFSKSIVTVGIRGAGAATAAAAATIAGVCVPAAAVAAGVTGAGVVGSSSLSGVNGVGSPFFSTATYSAFVRGRSYDVMSSHCERSA